MTEIFDKIDFFFDSLTGHQASILFLFLAACLYLGFRAIKQFDKNEDKSN